MRLEVSKYKELDVIEHIKGGRFTILAPPNDNVLLAESGEPFYSYRDHRNGRIWVNSQSEVEGSNFSKVKKDE